MLLPTRPRGDGIAQCMLALLTFPVIAFDGASGRRPGTAREVVTRILRKEGPMTPEKILQAVLKQRKLERNTIMLNLQNKKFFKRIADGKYTTAK